MTSSYRAFVNTIAQYARTIINMVLSLFTVRLVLSILGESDFGIYSLVAGVVAMLSFIINSMISTTQRFISYYQGKGDPEKLKDVFSNSLIVHLLIAVVIVLLLEMLCGSVFDGFLNVPIERIPAARIVFQLVVVIVAISFISSPFRALLISHENIVYISIIDVMDGVLKVLLVLFMVHIPYDKLVLYGCIMLGIQLFNFTAFAGYGYLFYEECILPSLRRLSKKYVKELFSYAGWSVYSSGCIVGRQQGISIMLNRLMGPLINAAYGLAFQIAGYLGSVSSSLVNAVAPQIVKAEGGGQRQKALWLSSTTCKFMFFLLSAVCIPCLFEIDNILSWWLEDVPNYSALFCIMVMIAGMIDATTVGLAHINQAIGRIGPYSLAINTPKLLSLPLVWLCLRMGYPMYTLAVVYCGIEMICTVLRIPFIKKTAGLDSVYFIRNVLLKEILPAAICIFFCFSFTHLFQFRYRFIVTFSLSLPVYGISFYLLGTDSKEKEIVNEVLHNMKSRISFLFKWLHQLKELYYTFLGHYFPERLIRQWYKVSFHKEIDLDDPKDICEKISWMKLHADMSLWTRCADKVEVRAFVQERGLGHTLNELYGVYENANEIDFDRLPEQFVLKTNNGGGGNNVILVKSKAELDIQRTISQLNGWLKQPVGNRWVEPHYKDIKPLIIAEKYLQPEAGESSLLDYKFYCFDGKVDSVFFCSDREFGEGVHYSTYSLDWQYLPEKTLVKYRTDKTYPKPCSLDKMIEYSSILSKGTPFVRVDWYEVDGHPVFGEMTFTPGGGFMNFHSMEYLEELGAKLTLPEAVR